MHEQLGYVRNGVVLAQGRESAKSPILAAFSAIAIYWRVNVSLQRSSIVALGSARANMTSGIAVRPAKGAVELAKDPIVTGGGHFKSPYASVAGAHDGS